MPGESFRGPLPELTEEQATLRDALAADVRLLAETIGERNVIRRNAQNDQAAEAIQRAMQATGRPVRRQTYRAQGQSSVNLICEVRGAARPEEIVVVGAHYDTVSGSPGANDNGSGVAALLAIARDWDEDSAKEEPGRTLRLLAFANEEVPFFQTRQMGSYVYAQACRAKGEKIVGMISLETIGYYSDRPGSQQYPAPYDRYYPSAGNFIAFVSNPTSEALLRQCVASFRRHAKFPSEGGALPPAVPGVGWSDHWSFWQFGYPALMVTDTAPFRYPHYHLASDTPDKLDFERMARVVEGLQHVVRDLVQARQ